MFGLVGWVPNISGHLSFSLIGERQRPRALRVGRLLPGGARFIAALQSRSNDDLPLPAWMLSPFVLGLRQHWLLHGTTRRAAYPALQNGVAPPIWDEMGCLSGVVTMIPSQRERSARSLERKILRECRATLRATSPSGWEPRWAR